MLEDKYEVIETEKDIFTALVPNDQRKAFIKDYNGKIKIISESIFNSHTIFKFCKLAAKYEVGDILFQARKDSNSEICTDIWIIESIEIGRDGTPIYWIENQRLKPTGSNFRAFESDETIPTKYYKTPEEALAEYFKFEYWIIQDKLKQLADKILVGLNNMQKTKKAHQEEIEKIVAEKIFDEIAERI